MHCNVVEILSSHFDDRKIYIINRKRFQKNKIDDHKIYDFFDALSTLNLKQRKNIWKLKSNCQCRQIEFDTWCDAQVFKKNWKIASLLFWSTIIVMKRLTFLTLKRRSTRMILSINKIIQNVEKCDRTRSNLREISRRFKQNLVALKLMFWHRIILCRQMNRLTCFYTYFNKNTMTIITCLFNKLWARVNVSCLWLSRHRSITTSKDKTTMKKEKFHRNRSSISRESKRQ